MQTQRQTDITITGDRLWGWKQNQIKKHLEKKEWKLIKAIIHKGI